MHQAESCAGISPRNYWVLWSMEVEASSVEEAAFRAYKTQKTQSASTAQYRIQCAGEQASEVRLADLAPIKVLSDREREVAKLVAEGATNAEIAERLGICLHIHSQMRERSQQPLLILFLIMAGP